jgi:hypothetical protein
VRFLVLLAYEVAVSLPNMSPVPLSITVKGKRRCLPNV